jgi:SAM-dependent methyltransferase
MKECSKSIPRRLADSRFATRYFVGEGVDIGGKPDPLALYEALFPAISGLKTWDWEDGDAQIMAGVADETYDFVFSSHCLEHLHDPAVGLAHWFRILKPGGHLIVCVPDEDLYEQGVWPSTHNRDHKHSFTLWKARSWSPVSINLIDLAKTLGPAADIVRLETIDQAFRRDLPRFDQTLTPVAECALELIVRKRTPSELAAGGRLPDAGQPDPALRRHFNQYRDDLATLKQANAGAPPFTNETPL